MKLYECIELNDTGATLDWQGSRWAAEASLRELGYRRRDWEREPQSAAIHEYNLPDRPSKMEILALLRQVTC